MRTTYAPFRIAATSCTKSELSTGRMVAGAGPWGLIYLSRFRSCGMRERGGCDFCHIERRSGERGARVEGNEREQEREDCGYYPPMLFRLYFLHGGWLRRFWLVEPDQAAAEYAAISAALYATVPSELVTLARHRNRPILRVKVAPRESTKLP